MAEKAEGGMAGLDGWIDPAWGEKVLRGWEKGGIVLWKKRGRFQNGSQMPVERCSYAGNR